MPAREWKFPRTDVNGISKISRKHHMKRAKRFREVMGREPSYLLGDSHLREVPTTRPVLRPIPGARISQWDHCTVKRMTELLQLPDVIAQITVGHKVLVLMVGSSDIHDEEMTVEEIVRSITALADTLQHLGGDKVTVLICTLPSRAWQDEQCHGKVKAVNKKLQGKYGRRCVMAHRASVKYGQLDQDRLHTDGVHLGRQGLDHLRDIIQAHINMALTEQR